MLLPPTLGADDSVVIALIISILPKKVDMVSLVCIFALGICFYLQALLMNGKMISMTGEPVHYISTLKAKNIVIWATLFFAILGAYYWLVVKRQQNNGEKLIALISAAILIMQTAGLVSLSLTNEARKDLEETVVLSTEGEFDLSKGKNVIIFILDTADGDYMTDALAEEPNLLDGLEGFVYYPDCVPTYSRTYPSIVYLLTKEKCYFNKPFEEYVNTAFKESTFWRQLSSCCEDVRLFTDAGYVGKAGWNNVKNLKYTDSRSLSSLNIFELIKAAKKIGMYRSAPYAAKEYFLYSDSEINKNVAKNYNNISYKIGEDDVFCQTVLEGAITTDRAYDSAFRLYHLFGPHPGNFLDENCKRIENASKAQTIRGEFKMIRSYLSQMKEQGVYDDATIIITADHGNSLGGEHLSWERQVTVTMLVKQANAENLPCKTSMAQVSHDDLFATVIDAFDEDGTQYGSAIYDIPEGLDRVRNQYYIALYSDIDGEVALREYKITGSAANFNNWELTGRNWNVDYSERTVSSHRLREECPDAEISPIP